MSMFLAAVAGAALTNATHNIGEASRFFSLIVGVVAAIGAIVIRIQIGD